VCSTLQELCRHIPDPEPLLDNPLSNGEKADPKLYDILEADELIQDRKMYWIGKQS
jgi:hypothetical protein